MRDRHRWAALVGLTGDLAAPRLRLRLLRRERIDLLGDLARLDQPPYHVAAGLQLGAAFHR